MSFPLLYYSCLYYHYSTARLLIVVATTCYQAGKVCDSDSRVHIQHAQNAVARDIIYPINPSILLVMIL